jgi:hypothetical protein
MFDPIRRLWKKAAALAVLGLALVVPAVARPPSAKPTHKAAPAKGPRVGRSLAPKVFRAGGVRKQLAVGPALTFPHTPGTTLDTTLSTPDFSLKSPTVNVVFRGNNWSAADRQTVLGAVQSILGGPYLSALNQPNYGSDGKATFGGSQTSNAPLTLDDTFQGGALPSGPSLDAFVRTLPTANNPNTVHVVVNNPQDSRGRVGDNVHTTNGAQIYVSSGTLPDGSLDKDLFTALFSHEMAEAMTSGVAVTDPGHFNLGVTLPGGQEFSQICDNEPEAINNQGYHFSLPGSFTDATGKVVQTTNLVQAYWSQRDGTFIVPESVGGPLKPAHTRPGHVKPHTHKK